MLSPRLRATFAATACAAVAFGAAACGGDDTSSSSTSAALSADEFRSQANAVCKTFNDQNATTPDPTGPTEIAAYLDKMLPMAQEELTKLEALTPPVELKPDFDASLTAQGKSLDLIGKARDRVKGGEDAMSVIQEVSPEINTLNDEAKAKQRAIGLTECAADKSDTSTTASTPTTPTFDTTSTTPYPPTDTTSTPPIDTTSTSPIDTETDTDTTASPSGTVDASVFSQDTTEFGQKLQDFGRTLQEAAPGGTSAVAAKASELRADLDDIDRITERMRGYTVDNPALETRRAKIVEAAPDVTRLGNELLDAAQSGDTSKLATVGSEFTQALSRLSTAAVG